MSAHDNIGFSKTSSDFTRTADVLMTSSKELAGIKQERNSVHKDLLFTFLHDKFHNCINFACIQLVDSNVGLHQQRIYRCDLKKYINLVSMGCENMVVDGV